MGGCLQAARRPMPRYGWVCARHGWRSVFDGGTGWHYWTRLALHAATQIWGGSDFLLIPHRDGQVLPALLDAVAVYEPDHVALLQRTAGQHELNSPGTNYCSRVEQNAAQVSAQVRFPRGAEH